MPIYEYACEACGHKFEKLMKIGAETPPCKSCGAAEVKKLVSASAFVLKGAGWYKDHYGLKKGGSGSSDAGSSSGEAGAPTPAPTTAAPKDGAKAAPAAPAPAPAAPASKPASSGGKEA